MRARAARRGVAALLLIAPCVVAGCRRGTGDPVRGAGATVAESAPSHAGAGGPAVSEGEVDAYARFVAGIRTRGGPLERREQSPAWIRFSEYFDRSWKTFEERQLEPMRTWRPEALGSTASAQTPVLYPFGGPDFVNPHTFFPRARAYCLIALDPLGEIPDFAAMDEAQMDTFFTDLRSSVYNLLHLDFFLTKEMRITLGKRRLGGVLPVLLFFMGRTGVRVLEVHYWLLKPGGAVVETPALHRHVPTQPGIAGLRIVLESPGSRGRQTLYYVLVNLDNESLHAAPEAVAFLERFTPATTFIKAASYLMFSPGFGDIKRFILDHSNHVLQTASGIPFRDFDPRVWSFVFFGTYTGPIEVFQRQYQQDLAQAYKRGTNVKPLPFGIGYHFRPGTSDLLFASRRERLRRPH